MEQGLGKPSVVRNPLLPQIGGQRRSANRWTSGENIHKPASVPRCLEELFQPYQALDDCCRYSVGSASKSSIHPWEQK